MENNKIIIIKVKLNNFYNFIVSNVFSFLDNYLL